MAIATLVALGIATVVAIFIIRRHGDSLQSAEFQARYSPLTEDLRLSSPVGRYWTAITLVRWAGVCLILVVCRDCQAVQITFLLLQSLAI